MLHPTYQAPKPSDHRVRPLGLRTRKAYYRGTGAAEEGRQRGGEPAGRLPAAIAAGGGRAASSSSSSAAAKSRATSSRRRRI